VGPRGCSRSRAAAMAVPYREVAVLVVICGPGQGRRVGEREQHGQGLDTGGVISQAAHHGLRYLRFASGRGRRVGFTGAAWPSTGRGPRTATTPGAGRPAEARAQPVRGTVGRNPALAHRSAITSSPPRPSHRRAQPTPAKRLPMWSASTACNGLADRQEGKLRSLLRRAHRRAECPDLGSLHHDRPPANSRA
jgi:hypothetical protein